MSIYQPSEDSYLLQESLTSYLKTQPKTIKILDMGSGSGIQALTCKKLGFTNITAIDINPEVIKHIKQQDKKIQTTNLNKKIKIIQSNLFSNIKTKNNKKQKFDLIIFNPPYLPFDPREPKDSQLQTTGGKKGYEIIIKFLKQAKKHLNKDSTLLLLISSLSKPRIIKQEAKKLNYKYEKINQQKLPFFEELFIFKIKIAK